MRSIVANVSSRARRRAGSAGPSTGRPGTMRSGLKVGMTGERRFVVEPAHAIDFAEGGMPAILCTPWLVWFLEPAARDAVVPFLDEGESTVGSHVDVDHLAATPVGQVVTCLARV